MSVARALLGISAGCLALGIACSLHQDPSLLDGSEGGAGGSPDEAGALGGEAGDDGGTSLGGDGASGADASPPPPSYCQGLTFFVSFDQGLNPEVGDTTARVAGGIGTAPGRFGNAGAMVLDAGDDANIAFYDTHDGGAPFYAAGEGTVAFWFKRQVPSSPITAFVRPLANAKTLAPAGPAMATGSAATVIALYQNLGAQPIVGLSFPQLAPYLHPGDFDHWVFAWHLDDDAGIGRGLVAVNGALGELNDGGTSPPITEDDAGNYDVPYAHRASVSIPPYPGPFTSLRIGGTTGTSPRGDMDELAMWNRMLTRAEMGALYKSGVSLRAACGLP